MNDDLASLRISVSRMREEDKKKETKKVKIPQKKLIFKTFYDAM